MRRKAKKRGVPEPAKPQMTSLVDVLTVLVFFLLKNFSTEGDIVTPAQGLTLPSSTSKEKPEQAIVIAISSNHIMAEGRPIATVQDEEKRPGYRIPALTEWLEKRRQSTESISKFDSTVGFTGKLSIQGDEKIPFALLQKVLMTCGEKGYSDFALTVNQVEKRK
jgi:biopolymer transport protein ExbD